MPISIASATAEEIGLIKPGIVGERLGENWPEQLSPQGSQPGCGGRVNPDGGRILSCTRRDVKETDPIASWRPGCRVPTSVLTRDPASSPRNVRGLVGRGLPLDTQGQVGGAGCEDPFSRQPPLSRGRRGGLHPTPPGSSPRGGGGAGESGAVQGTNSADRGSRRSRALTLELSASGPARKQTNSDLGNSKSHSPVSSCLRGSASLRRTVSGPSRGASVAGVQGRGAGRSGRDRASGSLHPERGPAVREEQRRGAEDARQREARRGRDTRSRMRTLCTRGRAGALVSS